MKKKIIFTALLISILGLGGCLPASVEEGPVVINETKDKENITNTPYPTETAEKSFPYTIAIEGTQETINCNTFESDLGYQILYDIDRFTVTSEDGIDSFMAANPDPDLYPYIYLNISRVKKPDDLELASSKKTDIRAVFGPEDKLLGFVSVKDSELLSGDELSSLGYIKKKDVVAAPIETVVLGESVALHYTLIGGTKWNSPITEYYFVTTDNYVYCFEAPYYMEASEGYGARIKAMLDTITFQ